MKNFTRVLLILIIPIALFALAGCQNTSATQSRPSAKQAPVRQDAYVDFTQERYEELLGNRPFALFFHAPWCPTCWAVEADILENIAELPEGAVIFKVDYDTATELKKTYNIVSQSVIVMVDSNGEPVKTLVAPSFATLKNNFANLLP